MCLILVSVFVIIHNHAHVSVFVSGLFLLGEINKIN